MKLFRNALVLAAALGAAAASRLPAQTPIGPGGLEPDADRPTTRAGTRGANFLQIGVGARAQALAGAATASQVGPTAWYWNPAGSAAMENFSIAATRNNLYTDLDISQNYFGAGLPIWGGVIGAHVITLSSGDIPRTTEGNPIGGDPVLGANFEWSSTAIGLGFARRLTDRLDLGVNLKYVSEGITDARAGWGAIDVGTQFRTGIYGLTIGATIQNVGPASRMRGSAIDRVIDEEGFSEQLTNVEFSTQDLELPTLFRFAVNSDLFGRVGSLFGQQAGGQHTLSGEVTFDDAIDTDVQLAGGLEYAFRDMVFLRAGKRFFNDDRAAMASDGFASTKGTYGLSFGGGVRLPVRARSVRFDYAFTSLGDLENVQVFSFEFGR